MKKTNIILAIMMLVASMASAQQAFTKVSLQAVKGETSITFMLSSEANATNFRIEASNNGTDYKIIGVMPSKGNTVLPRSYNYRVFETGYRYYRVGKVSMNGSLVYSHPLEMNKQEATPRVPANGPATQTLATTTR